MNEFSHANDTEGVGKVADDSSLARVSASSSSLPSRTTAAGESKVYLDGNRRAVHTLRGKRLESSTTHEHAFDHDEGEGMREREHCSDLGHLRKQRKKRRTYSCDLCRKFKTRCDFEPTAGKCHRCHVLNLECSLTKDRQADILRAAEGSGEEGPYRLPHVAQSNSSNQRGLGMDQRLQILENQISGLSNKLDFILLLLQGSNTAILNANAMGGRSTRAYMGAKDSEASPAVSNASDDEANYKGQLGWPPLETGAEKLTRILPIQEYRKSGFNSLKLSDPPFKLIYDLDSKLFPSKALSEEEIIAQNQRPFVVARVNFMSYFGRYEQLCLNLSREFLVKSHFWIIPGGIKEIDREYVKKHVFITSVFTVIAMGFAENKVYEEEQELLYPLVERLLANTLTMSEKLTDHDIEAILYCCMFSISRKSKRHRQLRFNSLIMCNFAINSLLTIIDYHKIKERVLVREEYQSIDLYHLRILNSLTACKFQYSIGHGEFTVQDELSKEFNNLTAKFPQANFGDDIKISEINLSEIVSSIFLNFGLYFREFSSKFRQQYTEEGSREASEKEAKDLVFPELEYWLINWDELLSKDGGGVLLFSYHFYYIMLCRTLLTERYDEDFRNDLFYFRCALHTMKNSCFALLNGFLKLPPSLLKGAPVNILHQLVYACLTVSDFLLYYEPSERQLILNMCTKIYWHLNAIGEKSNEATENVGKIIKALIDTSKDKNTDPTKLVPGNHQLSSKHNSVGQLTSLASDSLASSPTGVGSLSSSLPLDSGAAFSLPDVDQFNSFEDFFQDFFGNLKPTTQSMFSSLHKK
ncbi:AFR722Cp [Eremothecium gossypii ATCC 10895]|uniref:Transcriptional activator of proteases prtT n=1 Tax=Eremothecium gossypii (strain ATCC 10895 / CBS 109.51 / FGSC 9923 / NRRL Y-1056) TaxID=284811 RepID=Q751V3_EREGS|nr:AFR722Cp [Eremothecium gossypii ATCC 10895]AAS54094.2 AFR722Cp [Eremothecium gossypii ATCC 10895]AEY98409.1 FAFR722Cp [Eremothecium gossypii FDAG1]